jgi:hypothetical protein
MEHQGRHVVPELRPPVDFNPPIPRRDPTVEELWDAWDTRERGRIERERARQWDAARKAAREEAVTGMSARVMQEIEVDLGAVLEDVLESDAWTARN